VKPRIGICTYVERARWRRWDTDAALIPTTYVQHIQRAGGLALLLPPDPTAVEDPDPLLDGVDGLLLAGGLDLGPASYGADPHPASDEPSLERDAFELALARRALERDIPFLGVCRGMQVMNVARGGTLIQHLPEAVGHEEHRRVLGTFDGADHDVRLAEGSLAARAAGELDHSTKSHHHQGVERIGAGLEITGRATVDDLPEALEDPDRRFALGVQWHPEADEASRVIGALVEAARDGRISAA
jgi:putative glutamine amidotransferase